MGIKFGVLIFERHM